jgi:hypothetical protein
MVCLCFFCLYCVYFVLLFILVFIANKLFYLRWCYFLRLKKETSLALVVLLHIQLIYQFTKLEI